VTLAERKPGSIRRVRTTGNDGNGERRWTTNRSADAVVDNRKAAGNKYLMGAGHPAVSEANREAVPYALRSVERYLRETWRAMRRASGASRIET